MTPPAPFTQPTPEQSRDRLAWLLADMEARHPEGDGGTGIMDHLRRRIAARDRQIRRAARWRAIRDRLRHPWRRRGPGRGGERAA